MAPRVIKGKTSNVQRPTSNVELQNFFRHRVAEQAQRSHNSSPKMIDPPYRTVAVASTFSPRFLQVLAEAKRVRDRLCRQLHLIYVGTRDERTTKKFADALVALALPEDSAIHYQEGKDAALAILDAA